MIGSIAKAVLSRLREKEGEMVLIDAEAGLEHFGRRVDAGCDLVLAVVDPSFESLAMAARIRELAEGAGVQAFFILNKVEDSVRGAMCGAVESSLVVATMPRSDAVFLDSLHGRTLSADMVEMDDLCRFLGAYKKPPVSGIRL